MNHVHAKEVANRVRAPWFWLVYVSSAVISLGCTGVVERAMGLPRADEAMMSLYIIGTLVITMFVVAARLTVRGRVSMGCWLAAAVISGPVGMLMGLALALALGG